MMYSCLKFDTQHDKKYIIVFLFDFNRQYLYLNSSKEPLKIIFKTFYQIFYKTSQDVLSSKAN